jgi:hypothetical protein
MNAVFCGGIHILKTSGKRRCIRLNASLAVKILLRMETRNAGIVHILAIAKTASERRRLYEQG